MLRTGDRRVTRVRTDEQCSGLQTLGSAAALSTTHSAALLLLLCASSITHAVVPDCQTSQFSEQHRFFCTQCQCVLLIARPARSGLSLSCVVCAIV